MKLASFSIFIINKKNYFKDNDYIKSPNLSYPPPFIFIINKNKRLRENVNEIKIKVVAKFYNNSNSFSSFIFNSFKIKKKVILNVWS